MAEVRSDTESSACRPSNSSFVAAREGLVVKLYGGRGLLIAGLAVLLLVGPVACGGEQEADAVESGTYTGTLEEVVPEETEIYVELEDGRTIELYFSDETELTDSEGESISFETLSSGDRVRVEVEQVGQRNDPIAVTLLDSSDR